MSNESPKCIAVWIGWTYQDEWISRLIVRVAGGPYSHSFVRFDLEDGRHVYFESLFTKGVVGPRDFADLILWQAKDSRRRLTVEKVHWFTRAQCQAVYQRAVAMVGTAGYGKLQLLSHWWMERMGKRYGFRMRNTPSKVTCAEFKARILHPDLDLRDEIRDHFDAVTPHSAGVQYHRIFRTLQASGAFDQAIETYCNKEKKR
jgi:hypothetical protein